MDVDEGDSLTTAFCQLRACGACSPRTHHQQSKKQWRQSAKSLPARTGLEAKKYKQFMVLTVRPGLVVISSFEFIYGSRAGRLKNAGSGGDAFLLAWVAAADAWKSSGG
jgi:hypothetical protein